MCVALSEVQSVSVEIGEISIFSYWLEISGSFMHPGYVFTLL